MMQEWMNDLKELCEICAPSGGESPVREYLISRLTEISDVTWRVDPLGNLIVQKQGKLRVPKKLMITAHMDEVGFLVTYIHTDGTLSFAPVGGVEDSVVIGRQVLVGDAKLPGVIGDKPIHLMTKSERSEAPDISKLVIDIGTKSRAESEALVSLGDYVVFPPNFETFGKNKIKSKAIDDRIGCALLLNLLKETSIYDFTAAFLVQEEIGTRGAKTAAFAEAPDFAIVLEATTSADIPDVPDDQTVCQLGNGAVISFMDRGTIYDRKLVALGFEICRENNIPCQTKTRIAGGNDAGAIHVSLGGVRTVALSLPCRYLHAPVSVADTRDIESMERLLTLFKGAIQGFGT